MKFFLIIFFYVTFISCSSEESGFQEIGELSDAQNKSIVTVQFKSSSPDVANVTFYAKLKSAIANALNKNSSPSSSSSSSSGNSTTISTVTGGQKKRRRRSPTSDNFSEDDVHVVKIDPVEKDGHLRTPIYVEKHGSNPESAERVKDSIEADSESISKEVGLPFAGAQVGFFSGDKEETGGGSKRHERQTIWEAHRWLFLAILIFIGISIFLIILCCICLACQRKSTTTDQKPHVERSDEPLVRVGSHGPMQEQSPPNEPPPIDEESGWIIPLDQMTQEELEQPEVQVSKL